MDRPRCLARLAATFAIGLLLLDNQAQALVVAGGSTVNTTSSGFNDIFYNVGLVVGHASTVYLGDGWALTAQHVTVALPNAQLTFDLPNGTSASYKAINQVTLPGSPDLQLVQLAQAPPLPSIFQNISTSPPTTGSVVAMVGGGDYNAGPLYWNKAASTSGTLNLGATSATAAMGTPNPIPSDTFWTSNPNSVPAGAYQDAGFAWGGSGRLQWGESVVTFAPGPSESNSNTFITTFYNSTYDPPTSSVWGAGAKLATVSSEVAAIGSNMAQVATGDSGGGVFTKSGSGWVLSGILDALNDIGTDRQTSSPPTNAAYGDLAYSIDLSSYATSIQTIITSTSTWTGQTNGSWDNTTLNWSNAANNGATAFAASVGGISGSAIFADKNPQFKIPLNPSSSLPAGITPFVGMQSVVVQSAGVSAYAITFTNTGSANGGVDYVLSDAGGTTGITGSTGLDLSGNGNGVGGAVYLTGANSFTGRVQVFVGRLNLQNGSALGNSANASITSGAALELQTTGSATKFGLTATGSTGIPLLLNGSGIGGTGVLDNISGSNTYAGPITLGSATTIGSSSSSDQLSLTGGVNMVSGGLTFPLTVAGSGNTVISGTAFSSVWNSTTFPGGTLTKTGSGILSVDFSAANSPASNLLVATSPLAVGGGTFRIIGAASGSTSQTLASLSINTGASAVVDNATNSVVSNLTFSSGTIARSVGGTVDFTLPTTGNIGFTTPPGVTGGILGGWATVGGANWATLSGNNVAVYSGAVPVNSLAIFTSNTNYDVTGSLLASGAANSLRFTNGATSASVNLTGTVPITTGGILIPSSVTSADSISGGTLQGESGADLVVIQNSAQTFTISSTIADNGAATGLTKSGSGALSLNGSNTYSGLTTLNAGTLNINSNSALGSGTLVINGGTIDNTFGGSIGTTNAETWNGNFTFQGTNPLSQTTGAITLTASPTITINSGTNPLTIGGNISGNFGLTLAGSGTLALGGTNTFTGGVTINGGTLQIGSTGALNSTAPNVVAFGAAGTLNLNGNSVGVGGLSSTSGGAIEASTTSASATLTINGIGNYAFAGNIGNGGSGPLTLVKSGSGTQILSGTNSYSGGTTINAGVLQFDADADLPPGSANITVNSGGTLAAGSAIDQPFITHVAAGSTGTIALAANSSNPLNFNTANLQASLGSAGSYAYSGTLTPNAGNYNLGGGGGLLTFSGSLSGANTVTILNGGNVAPTAANTFSGGTTIDAGTTLLVSSDTTAVGNGSAAEIGQVPSSPTTNITINGGTFQATASFTLNANRGITLGSSGGTIDVDGVTSAAPNTLTYNGIITGLGSLTLPDTGTLVLGGLNNYTGGTNVNAGTLRTGAVDTIPQSSAVALGLGGTLQLNGNSQSIGSLTGGGVVADNSSTSATLTVGNDNTNPTAGFFGVLTDTTASNTGSLALTKVGSGTMTLSGLNTYTGGTTVSGGILATVGGGTLGPGSLRISLASGPYASVSIGTTQSISSLTNSMTDGGFTLVSVASGATLTSTGPLTNTGTLNVGATGYAGTLVVDGAPTLNANSQLLLNAGTLQFNVTSGTATIQSGASATVAAGATLQLAGTVSALSNGSVLNPANGQLVNITNNGSTASGGGLSVVGTNQSVGMIAGTPAVSGGTTTYGGDTVVGAGGSLTASQILQNTLTIGAGASVTIRPSVPGMAVPAGSTSSPADAESTSAAPASETALEIEHIQNRIAALEQLEAADSDSSAGLLDETPPALLASTTGAAVPSATSVSEADPTVLASEIAHLLATENSLLASENSPSVTSAGDLSSGGSLAAGAVVPEPSGVILALIASCLLAAGAAWRCSALNRLMRKNRHVAKR